MNQTLKKVDFISNSDERQFIEDIEKRKKELQESKDFSFRIASIIRKKFEKWISPKQISKSFDKIAPTERDAFALLQTLVFHENAVCKVLENGDIRFMIVLNREDLKKEIQLLIQDLEIRVEALKRKLKECEKDINGVN